MYDAAIVDAIVDYVENNGWGSYGWYVGIATVPKIRLFTDHNVAQIGGVWICRPAANETEARDTEKELLLRKDFKGAPGGGDKPTYVYAYKITATTRE